MPNRRIFSADLAAPFVAPLSLWPSVNISPLPSFIFTIRCSLKTFSQLDGWVTDALGNPSKMRTKKKKKFSLIFRILCTSSFFSGLTTWRLAIYYYTPGVKTNPLEVVPSSVSATVGSFLLLSFFLPPRRTIEFLPVTKQKKRELRAVPPLLVVGSVIQH